MVEKEFNPVQYRTKSFKYFLIQLSGQYTYAYRIFSSYLHIVSSKNLLIYPIYVLIF